MSRKLLEGLEGMVGDSGVERYSPGSLTYDPRLVEELAAVILTWAHTVSETEKALKSFIAEELPPLLRTQENFDAQDFIDAIVFKIAAEGNESHVERASQDLLSPLINTLYSEGHDNLLLNLTPFPVMPQYVALDLEGTEDRPLSLSCKLADAGGDSANVGDNARHCHLYLHSEAKHVGRGSSFSCFALEKPAQYIGQLAQECTFRLAYAHEVESITPKNNALVVSTQRGVITPFRVIINSEEVLSTVYLEGDFFRRGNRLLIPEGEGWKEVTP